MLRNARGPMAKPASCRLIASDMEEKPQQCPCEIQDKVHLFLEMSSSYFHGDSSSGAGNHPSRSRGIKSLPFTNHLPRPRQARNCIRWADRNTRRRAEAERKHKVLGSSSWHVACFGSRRNSTACLGMCTRDEDQVDGGLPCLLGAPKSG
ncbi:hypothetical protein GGTG_08112 [Gaeumannomyces tritici R3-111a-1]|uniref:Uncharacterized protein n=1 Tax=Gaeumannomyces tritici (strain R3-111a-1) TaxID=644352 RepID=J3P3M5_GAET3|nr:hypothetical protein GGTG_08112 [Gaeumannomyces tritici R3-111a-1]EJT74269.1 hypothetical protein GGTG_08112 [Gaeumannomyces tritici R3-111a-1]